MRYALLSVWKKGTSVQEINLINAIITYLFLSPRKGEVDEEKSGWNRLLAKEPDNIACGFMMMSYNSNSDARIYL